MYPAGLFGWKLVAKFRCPISVKYVYGFDEEAKVYVGKAVSLKGIHAEGETLEELFSNFKSATCDILDIELNGKFGEVVREYQESNNLSFA
jgi:predicted RNase H-like HicB family nuclease